MVQQYEEIMPEGPEGEHDVYFDYGGNRLTCHTCQDDLTRTALKQPCTSEAQWQEILEAFRRRHPWPGRLPRPWDR